MNSDTTISTTASVRRRVRLWRFDSAEDPNNTRRPWYRKLLDLWITFGERLGSVMSILLLTTVYLVLLGPMKLALFLMRHDPLRSARTKDQSFWISRSSEPPTVENARRQF